MAIDCTAVATEELKRLHDIQVLMQALVTALGGQALLNSLPLQEKL